MATAPTVSIQWIPEDDLLLKNAVEAGASLEALAKGAVLFSRRYTLRELRERWRSLLYDPDISAQACAQIFELEISGTNPVAKFNKPENIFIGSREASQKRKSGSIRRKYNAMRKKFRSELFSNSDLGFFEPNPHEFSGQSTDFQKQVMHDGNPLGRGCMIGDGISDNLGFQEEDLDILRDAFPGTITDIAVASGATNVPGGYGLDGNATSSLTEGGNNILEVDIKNGKSPLTQRISSMDENPHNSSVGFEGRQQFNPSNSDDFSSLQAYVFESDPHHLHRWREMQVVSASSIPVSMSLQDTTQNAEDTILNDVEGKENSSTVYTGEFADPYSLLNLSNEDGMLEDIDEKYAATKCSVDNTGSAVQDSIMDGHENDTSKAEIEPVTVAEVIPGTIAEVIPGTVAEVIPGTVAEVIPGTVAEVIPVTVAEVIPVTVAEVIPVTVAEVIPVTIPSPKPVVSEVATSSVHGDQQMNSQSEVGAPSKSTSSSDFTGICDGKICCTLNTEDTEIPCNDDIFLLIHPSTSFGSSATQPNTTGPMTSTGHEKDYEEALNFPMKANDSGKTFVWPPHGLPESHVVHPIVGRTSKAEIHGSRPQALLPGFVTKSIGDSSKGGSQYAIPKQCSNSLTKKEVAGVEIKVGQNPSTVTEAGSARSQHPESVVDDSVSDEEESEIDDDVPYYSDIEAMILETDLDPYEQDSSIIRQVPSYQYDDTKRAIIRLEQGARSFLKRAMTSQEALAILYGRHLMHYIRKSEVLLGRSTDDIHVDIDLSKEGRANKISRRQAIIKMEADGSFFLKNLGKSSLLVNGVAVACGQLLNLSTNCYIEIKGMSFVFEINQDYVRENLRKFCVKNKGKTGKSDWSAEDES